MFTQAFSHLPTPQRQQRFSALAALAICVAAGQLIAAETSAQQTILRWIDELGDADFAARSEAQRNLLDAGAGAVDALKKATRSADPEIRSRAKTLLAALEDQRINGGRRLFLANSSAFLDEADSGRGCPMPGWERFQKTIGDDRAARQLFIDLVRDQPKLMTAVGQPGELAAILKYHLSSGEAVAQLRNGERHAVSTARFAAVMWASAQSEGKEETFAIENFFCMLPESEFFSALRREEPPGALHRLSAAYIKADHDTDSDVTIQKLWLAIHFDLPAGRDLATRILKKTPVRVFCETDAALRCLAKFGKQDDIALVESLLDVEFGETEMTAGGQVEHLTCDLALATLVKIEARRSGDFGFTATTRQVDSVYGFSPILSSSARRAGIDAWKAAHRRKN